MYMNNAEYNQIDGAETCHLNSKKQMSFLQLQDPQKTKNNENWVPRIRRDRKDRLRHSKVY